MAKPATFPALSLAVGLFFPTAAPGSDFPAEALDFFEREVRPLLVGHCHKCHGDSKPKAGLRLTSRRAVLQGGASGPAAVAGKPTDSLLLQAVRRDAGRILPAHLRKLPRSLGNG
jgi:hypothetical protein